jgi:endonuclease G, mitochondrial
LTSLGSFGFGGVGGDAAEVSVSEPIAVAFEGTSDADDVLTFEFNGHDEDVLKYEHFSALMSATRRLCRFSAVNIDGNRPKKFARVG